MPRSHPINLSAVAYQELRAYGIYAQKAVITRRDTGNTHFAAASNFSLRGTTAFSEAATPAL